MNYPYRFHCETDTNTLTIRRRPSQPSVSVYPEDIQTDTYEPIVVVLSAVQSICIGSLQGTDTNDHHHQNRFFRSTDTDDASDYQYRFPITNRY